MINEDTLKLFCWDSAAEKSSGIIHYKAEMSSFSLIILECAITVTMDDQTTIEGPVLNWETKTKLFWLANFISYILIAFLNPAGKLALKSHFSLIIIVVIVDSV